MNRVEIMGRREIERINAWPTLVAVISITDPSVRGPCASAAKIACDNNLRGLLRLTFHDLDPLTHPEIAEPGVADEFRREQAGPEWMTESQAATVVSFWSALRLHVASFVVHCEAGISRSAGVAAAICALEGIDDKHCYTGRSPNAHVKALILRGAWGNAGDLDPTHA